MQYLVLNLNDEAKSLTMILMVCEFPWFKYLIFNLNSTIFFLKKSIKEKWKDSTWFNRFTTGILKMHEMAAFQPQFVLTGIWTK